ncbi:MAG: zinc ABC transporter substrate-binding protein [Microlunatus sp.]|nr:zinc ABC transporter substrate-binding protein [Microlunatus sp.]
MNRNLLALPAVLTAAALALVGCSIGGNGGASGRSISTAGAPISVVASTDVWGDIAASVGGDKVKVTSIITDPAADPHEYEASTRNQLMLAKAQVIIENGGGYDDFVDRMLKSADNRSATVLNAVKISGKAASPGGSLNEHVWYDFPSVGKVVDKIESAYTKADPADASRFQTNADTLKHKLAGLEKREADLKGQYAGEPVSITEPVPVYMLDAIGLVDKTPTRFSKAVEEDSDVSAKVLSQTLDLYSNHQVMLLVYNAQTSGPETEKVLAAAKQNGIPATPVTETLPAGAHYVSWMSGYLDAISSALGN